MNRVSAKLRRWCDTCLKVTVSWLDYTGEERCSGCDPEDPRHPGHGMPIRSWDEEW